MSNDKSVELLHKLHIVSGMIHRSQKFNRAIPELQRGQGRVLRTLNKEDGISQSELADRVNISPASLSELIVKLEQKHHIVKEVAEEDKRRHNIYITDEGRDIANKIIRAREETAEEVFSVLDEGEKMNFEGILDKLIDSLRD